MQELVVSDILQRGSRTDNTQALSAEEKFKNALSLSQKQRIMRFKGGRRGRVTRPLNVWVSENTELVGT